MYVHITYLHIFKRYISTILFKKGINFSVSKNINILVEYDTEQDSDDEIDDDEDEFDRDDRKTVITFWNLSQLTNQSIKNDEVSKRKIYSEVVRVSEGRWSDCPVTAFINSDILTGEGDLITRRSFWP